MLNEGTYTGRVTAWELGYTGNGDPQVVVVMQPIDSDEVVPWYGFFTEKTRDRTIKTLRDLGWVGDDVTDLDSLLRAGKEVSFVVEHNEWRGAKSARVKWFNLGGQTKFLRNTMNAVQKAQFAAMIRGTAMQIPAPSNATIPDALSSDDIPF